MSIRRGRGGWLTFIFENAFDGLDYLFGFAQAESFFPEAGRLVADYHHAQVRFYVSTYWPSL